MDDVLSSFLIKIIPQQDEQARKKFDESLNQVQTHAAEFGAKIGELPTIVNEATKRISSSLTEMYYAAQKNGATARELDNLRFAAEQSGEGADNAAASFNAFSQRIRDAASGTVQQYKSMFGVDVDPNHTMDAFLKVREKIEELRNRGDPEGLSRSNLYAKTFGIDEGALVPGRLEIFKKSLIEQAKRNEGLAVEKAVALTRAYNALAAALEAVSRKASSALFDKFGAVLDRLAKFLDDEDSQKRITKFFTDLATQIGYVFEDLSKLGPAFSFLWDALKEVGDWLQKIIGQPDSSGLAGVRHLLEFISGVFLVGFVARMVAGFALAFGPVTALLAALGALGIIGIGAYTAGEATGEAIGGLLGGRAGSGGFGPGEGAESGGHGAVRRGRMGYRGDGGSGPVAGGKNFDEKAPDIMNKLMTKYDLNREQAAGILGNLGHESAGFSTYHETGQAEGKGGVGWAQWTNSGGDPRRDKFEAWVKAHGLDPHSDEASYRYLTEGDPQFAGAVAAVKKETTIQGSMQAFEEAFERARIKAYSSRMRYAMRALSAKPPAIASKNILPDLHKMPDFKDFRKSIEGKPLGSEKHSMNEIHDHRSVQNDVNINVAGGFPVEKTARPLDRPRNADLIRNTASYAA